MANFCVKCGTELIDGVCPKCTQEQSTSIRQDEKFKRFFMNPKEKLVTTLGNTYIQNFLNDGSVRNGFSVVSDKRVYFQGKTYELVTKNNGRKKVIKTKKSRTVDLKDVTGTGYDSYSNVLAKILAFVFFAFGTIFFSLSMNAIADRMNNLSTEDVIGIIFMLIVCLIPGVVFLAVFLQSRVNLIAIQFAGGEIAFDINWFSEMEIEDFQKQLRLAKDKAIEEADNAVANKLQEAVSSATVGQQSAQSNSVADELAKYGDLLERGLITQEEFDKKKQELL